MERSKESFNDFLSGADEDLKQFIIDAHGLLIKNGYKASVELKASGYFVSYSHPKTKRSILNFFSRKKGLFVRLYADNHIKYEGLFDNFTDKMRAELQKAPSCKRMLNPADCNPKCIMGYDFTIGGQRYQKCRYQCFQFQLSGENMAVIMNLLESEIKERQ